MRILLVLVALALSLLTSGATAITACGQPLTQGPANRVLCCCPTALGGSCCGYVSFCGGAFVPGCICSGAKPERVDVF